MYFTTDRYIYIKKKKGGDKRGGYDRRVYATRGDNLLMTY